MNADPERADERRHMTADQIERRGLREPRLLEAMRSVPRHRFVLRDYQEMAYDDGPLPIGHGQTISQPYIVALMTDLLELTGAECVLEIGTGSGYQAAVLARLASEVHTVEIVAELARGAADLLRELGCDNVHCHPADGSLGWPAAAPYDGILVTAAAPRVPPGLLEQLKPGGRLVLPVGRPRETQYLERWTMEAGHPLREMILPVAFVPLRGEHGWR